MKQVIWGLLFFLLSNTSYADKPEKNTPKRGLLNSMKESYFILPKEVDTVNKLFSEGIFYGRLRFNSFGFLWGEELNIGNKALRKDHAIAALGGSLMYKSAYLNGFGFTLAGYTTQSRGTLSSDEAYLYKGGKDLLSRYDYITQGKQSISIFAQAYLEFHKKNSYLKAGRLIFESFLTASNDTKMIPNTFEGVTLETTDIPKTLLKVAYLTKQKLRDHSTFHSVLASADKYSNDQVFRVYTQNDDSAMHIGLKQSSLDALGINDRLMIADMRNHSVENLTLRMNYTAVPELISSAMVQADYEMHFLDHEIKPAIRYMQQFDNGAGAIGGANLKTVTAGYSDPDTLDSWLLGAKVDISNHVWKMRLGYTQVADKGDIVAPWRGFPTAGFSRAMAQYNWYANTKTYMIRADYDFDGAGLIPGVEAFVRYAVQDFDDEKIGVQADSNVLTLDVLKAFSSYPGLYMKLRMAHVNGDDDTVVYVEGNPIKKLDPSYDEARFEINYLF